VWVNFKGIFWRDCSSGKTLSKLAEAKRGLQNSKTVPRKVFGELKKAPLLHFLQQYFTYGFFNSINHSHEISKIGWAESNYTLAHSKENKMLLKLTIPFLAFDRV
jgi:hypothetical protein